jgi:hypothetical protein
MGAAEFGSGRSAKKITAYGALISPADRTIISGLSGREGLERQRVFDPKRFSEQSRLYP